MRCGQEPAATRPPRGLFDPFSLWEKVAEGRMRVLGPTAFPEGTLTLILSQWERGQGGTTLLRRKWAQAKNARAVRATP